MNKVLVVFPVLKGSRRFIIERGRRWSVIEHLLLDAVSRADLSAADLAAQSNLPRRVVIEAFIRLMRAGWVEIVPNNNGALFKITASGISAVQHDQLPAATLREPRWRGFAIEQLTGSVFRGRELELHHKSQIPSIVGNNRVVHLPASNAHDLEEMCEVFTTIEGEDEVIVGVDPGSEKLGVMYAIVTVENGKIEGLPARAPERLHTVILNRFSQSSTDLNTTANANVLPASPKAAQEEPPKPRPCAYDQSDLILDGKEHWQSLEKIISGASERVIIHSTFISEQRAEQVLPLLLRAAERGVNIDVLWGQDDLSSPTKSSQLAAQKMQAKIESAGRASSVQVHPFSTNSHAKIVIADSSNGWTATVGSCNWLASDYKSFDASFRIREPELVGQLMKKLAGLAQGRPGVWTEFAINLAVLGKRVMGLPPLKGRKVPIQLIYGAEHAELVLQARNSARSRIFAMSHRIGIAAESVTLLPALAAVEHNEIEASFYYGRTTGPLSGEESSNLTRSFGKAGLNVKPIHKPRIHAKVLGWDSSHLVVSSLNWLSADPSESKPYKEIGVMVEAPKITDLFLDRFKSLL